MAKSQNIGSHVALLEVHDGERWQSAAEVRVGDADAGFRSASTLEYDLDYVDTHELGATDFRAVSCRYPIGFQHVDEPRWPPFLLDLVPSGAARRHWEAKLRLPNSPSSDWSILLAGAAYPPGNVRVANALGEFDGPDDHPGFDRADVLSRGETFIEYARQCGAPISGSAGAGGDSPKFLLREDHVGRWHADGALPDSRTKACWLVKFPRTDSSSDRLVLRTEAAYHRVARDFGLRTFGAVTWENDCLFVPRFDRVVQTPRVRYLGLESLYSLAGVADFSAPLEKEKQAEALERHTTDPIANLREFVARDVLDVALGNTDNHARNTAVLKTLDGKVSLAPVYDLAPMILDRSMISRVSRWSDGADSPDWALVAAHMDSLGCDVRAMLHDLAPRVEALPHAMKSAGVSNDVIDRCKPRIEMVARGLRGVPR